MKKLSFFLMAMLMSVMSFAQTTESVVLASGVHDGSKITWTIANGNITISQLQAASSTAVNASYISAPRMYKGHIFKFETAEGYAITNIDITYNGSYYGTDLFAGTVIGNNNTVTKNTTDITATYSTATGGTHKIATTSAEGESMIALQIPNSAASGYKQLRPTAIKITYVKAATTTPNISCGDVTFGTVNSINNNTKEVEVVGENLSEAITATLETGAAFSVEGTLNANGGILTIKVTATEEGNYTDNLVLTSGTTTKTVAVSAKVVTCEGKGTKEAPYTVSDLTKLGNPGTKAWVMGYIIGEIKDNELSTSGFENNSNIALADAIGETKKYAPIQLPSGAIRDALNLVSNPANLNKQVALYGTLEAYFSMPGVKSVSEYEWVVAPVVNHTITVSANPAEGGVVTGGDEYEEGATATLTATANEGYEFVNWTENEVEVSTDAEYTFEVLADRALVANFEKAAPATETVYFIDVKKWGKVNVYAWTTDPIVAWPGAAATKEAEQIAGYDVYSYTLDAGAAANVIFNNNNGGSQTADLVWTAGKYYVMDIGWLTKEEAETKLAAPLPEVWTIVGAAGLMGKDWDLNAAENAMTKQGDGTYKLEKKGITLTAGTYEYKAAKDHDWAVSVPAGADNQKLTISTSGIYDVTFVLDVTAKKLTATATLKQAAVIIPTVVIAGDMNSWSTTKDKFTMSADSLTATLKTTLAVKNYGFKMVIGGNWQSDAKTITRAANSTKFTGANGGNSTLKADIAGDYLFTWEYATKTLTVTYPELPVEYTVTATVNPAETGTVEGAGKYEEGTEITLTATPAEGYEFVNWTKDEEVVSTENSYTFVVTADVALVANFKEAEPEIEWIEMELEISNLTTMEMPVGDVTYLQLMGRNDQEDADVMLFLNDYTGEEKAYEVNVENSYMTFGGSELTVIDGSITQSVDPELGDTVYAGIVHASVGEDDETMYVAFDLKMYALPSIAIELEDVEIVVNEESAIAFFNATWEGSPLQVEVSGFEEVEFKEYPECWLSIGDSVNWVDAAAGPAAVIIEDGVAMLEGEFTSFSTGKTYEVMLTGTLPVKEEPALKGVVKRAVQLGESVVVLTHEADGTARIYNVVGENISEVSQEGVIARDPENKGSYLAISDIAVTEDGKLVANNYVRCQFAGTAPEDGYKLGTSYYYIWDGLASAPAVWFTSQTTARSSHGDVGRTFAVKGTSTNAKVLVTAVHNNNRAVRMSLHSIIDGVYEEPNIAGGTYNNDYYFNFGLHTTANYYKEATQGKEFYLLASPLADASWIIEGELSEPSEFLVPAEVGADYAANQEIAAGTLGNKYQGTTIVTVGEQHLMVAPYADAEGKLAGVKILDVTAGFAAATEVAVADLDAAVEATAAATAVAVAENALTITLVADATIYTLNVELSQGPGTALENIAVEGKAVKAIVNGQLIIIKNGVQYNAQGAVVK